MVLGPFSVSPSPHGNNGDFELIGTWLRQDFLTIRQRVTYTELMSQPKSKYSGHMGISWSLHAQTLLPKSQLLKGPNNMKVYQFLNIFYHEYVLNVSPNQICLLFTSMGLILAVSESALLALCPVREG